MFREPVFGTQFWLEAVAQGAWIKVNGVGKIGLANVLDFERHFFRNWNLLKTSNFFVLVVEKLEIFLLSPNYPDFHDRYFSKCSFGVFIDFVCAYIPVRFAFKSLLTL